MGNANKMAITTRAPTCQGEILLVSIFMAIPLIDWLNTNTVPDCLQTNDFLEKTYARFKNFENGRFFRLQDARISEKLHSGQTLGVNRQAGSGTGENIFLF